MPAANENNNEAIQNERRAPEKIERIHDHVWNIYVKMKQGHKFPQKRDTRLGILKAHKVGPIGVVNSLRRFRDRCINDEMKNDIDMVVSSVKELRPDGHVKNFVRYRSKSNMKEDLEYFCLAVKKYKIEGNVEECDYILATFSCSSGIDFNSIGTGVGLQFAAAGLSALSFLTFGLFRGFKETSRTLQATAEKLIQPINQEDFETALEAAFIYELVQRGHAIINEDEHMLYLAKDD